MKRVLYVLVGALLGGALFGGMALAGAGGDKGDGTAEGVPAIVAEAPNARVAVYVVGGETAGQFTVVRQKGIVAVTNPSTGIFCLKAVSGVSSRKVVPIVSTEFSGTAHYDGFAQWSAVRDPCPSGTIKVTTFDAGDSALFNQVAFTVVID